MTFNPLKEKGIPLEKQLKSWYELIKPPYNKFDTDNYTRTRQILMNGIEIESWGFKHAFVRHHANLEVRKQINIIRRIESQQQMAVAWLAPANQTILDTTLGYEQVAVDLTAWLAQNEPDDYVKETYDFGLLEDFDHLYRYAQWAYMTEGTDANDILQGMTDVLIARPTQYHHNCNAMRIRKHYDKTAADPQTKANILTLVSAEQQTHNFYADHGFMYGNDDLRRTYAEICDVEEEHVSMYESLIDPSETPFEKLLVHEFTEVCNYYNCYKDESDLRLKNIWEEFLAYELEHLRIAAELFRVHENRDPEEVIGDKIFETSHFESQKIYVTNIIENETGKRLDGKPEGGYANVSGLPDDWYSYVIQEAQNKDGAPSEQTIRLINTSVGRDIVSGDEELTKKEPELLERALEPKYQAPNTVSVAEYERMVKAPQGFNKGA
jgi:rubrerythrin